MSTSPWAGIGSLMKYLGRSIVRTATIIKTEGPGMDPGDLIALKVILHQKEHLFDRLGAAFRGYD